VRFFGRKETLNERLMREAGLDVQADAAPPEPFEPQPRYEGPQFFGTAALTNPAVTGLARPRHWDAFTTAEAPAISGTEVEFVALPDGSILVEEEEGDAALEPLATAVEETLAPPYRAKAVRQTDSLWAVTANKIQVATFEADGDTIELTQTRDGKAVRVDGMPVFGSIPELERIGQEAGGAAYAVHAQRLDTDLWEVKAAAL
jgi:hypothetical protein